MRTYALVVRKLGGPEAFTYEEITLDPPGSGEVLIEHKAIGVNFIDTYFRTGIYPWPGEMPIIVGAEGSGLVLETGPDVSELKAGDRVAYTGATGAYSQHRLIAAEKLISLPKEISFEIAAASILKGLTVQYLLHRTFQVQKGHKILFHAAAGGVGSLAGQWASHLGAETIGTVGSAEKGKLALANGYHHIINYNKENFVERVKEITNGQGVDVVYDSVGQNTYPHSLKCLKRLGHWVSFGQSSGLIKDMDLQDLARNGSLTATRPRLFDYIHTREELEVASQSFFDALRQKILKVEVNQKFKLEEGSKAHSLLENRKTVGSTILIP